MAGGHNGARGLRYLREMTKSDLIDRMAEATNRTKREAEEAIDTVLASIAEALGKGEKVDVRGFGSFQVTEKGQRQGRNPRTGEPITIAARKAAVFKPSKELAERVNRAGMADINPEHTAVQDGTPMAEPTPESAKVHGDKIT